MTELVGNVRLFSETTNSFDKELVGYVTLVKPFEDESGSGFSSLVHDTITVTAQNITDKKFNLTVTSHKPDSIIFLPEGGIPQFPQIDFIVSGKELSWASLGLDGFIEENEIIHVYYS